MYFRHHLGVIWGSFWGLFKSIFIFFFKNEGIPLSLLTALKRDHLRKHTSFSLG